MSTGTAIVVKDDIERDEINAICCSISADNDGGSGCSGGTDLSSWSSFGEETRAVARGAIARGRSVEDSYFC